MSVSHLVTTFACVAFLVPSQDQKLPKVLFYSDPQQSDNDIVRRTRPDLLSPAEKQFVEITKGIFEVTATQDSREVTRDKLKDYRAVVFFTAINPPADKEGLVEWVMDGGAFVGIHSTANTFQNYAPFGEMLGAYYESRPWRAKDKPLAKARIKVEDTGHPATKHLGDEFEVEDDLYLFKNWDRRKVHVLLSLDPMSLDMTKVKRKDTDMAIAWTKTHGKGRVFYTALGDAEHVWKDARYQTHLIEGVKWTIGK
ncbi:MAG: ThuA domain-containing protein [Acidobacteria bacterium]|nr:ThuA domain-containing protein [Acidobacteriota bacterium]MCI0623373.1 ThuA domain-containing protein [Acidobacteriota bacterium]MCI0721600.1 ThuA domain-containing protein [Acidobacteriota bacterium]